MLTAMAGGYAGANPADLPAALTAALAHMALAGERAAREVIATQLGTFHQKLFDALAAVTPADLGGFPGVREL